MNKEVPLQDTSLQLTTTYKMFVYELMVDYDMTTRSSPSSEGLFYSRLKAEQFRSGLDLKSWQWSEIVEREVK